MNKLKKTLTDLSRTMSDNSMEFLLTRYRYNSQPDPDDFDVLVKSVDYMKLRKALTELGYEEGSHDKALGGRLYNFQVNLIKKDRVKIDLHKDFTWRKQKYIDTEILWKSKKVTDIAGAKTWVPDEILDTFLIVINIIFEKTYMRTESELIRTHFKHLKNDKRIILQSKKYNYEISMKKFLDWFERCEQTGNVIFLPFSLVVYSYWEKFIREGNFDLTSFFYYLFFRTRYLVNKTLPYD